MTYFVEASLPACLRWAGDVAVPMFQVHAAPFVPGRPRDEPKRMIPTPLFAFDVEASSCKFFHTKILSILK